MRAYYSLLSFIGRLWYQGLAPFRLFSVRHKTRLSANLALCTSIEEIRKNRLNIVRASCWSFKNRVLYEYMEDSCAAGYSINTSRIDIIAMELENILE